MLLRNSKLANAEQMHQQLLFQRNELAEAQAARLVLEEEVEKAQGIVHMLQSNSSNRKKRSGKK
ncbi:MAG: hypothetical protein AB2556_24105 [Candidatus Thiodiazotropha sp.]